MKVKITEDCVNCGVCCDISPDVFELGDDLAIVKGNPVDEKYRDEVEEAADACPTSAIIIDD